MTGQLAPPAPAKAPPRRRGLSRALNWVGWLLISAGLVIGLYLVYSLFFTGLQTQAAQSELLEEWERSVGEVLPAGEGLDEPIPEAGDPAPADPELGGAVPEAERDVEPGGRPTAADLGDGVAILEFVRPGSDERPVQDGPLMVVEGVSRDHLKQGPGRYPDSALPGQDGNFAVAGHRTTYGAPFFELDQLVDGDEVVVTDRSGRRWRYRVVARQIVSPADGWVLDADPLGRDSPMLTLTTCHPRFSAAQRMIVFAELVA